MITNQEYIRLWQELMTEFDNFKAQPVAVMPAELYDPIADQMEFKACYNNVFHAMSYFHCMGSDAFYMCGIAVPDNTGVPVDHAWLEVDGEAFDPTWQKFSRDERSATYHPISRLNVHALEQLITENNMTPPCALEIFTKFVAHVLPLEARQ